MTLSGAKNSKRSFGWSGYAGFTLLEVILAIAILALSLTAISEVVRLSFTNVAGATDAIESRMVAQSVIDQLKCGAIEIADAGPMQVGQDDALADWSVEIIVEPAAVEQLLQVRVLVGRTLDPGERPACEVVRWFQDPQFAQAAAAAATTAAP